MASSILLFLNLRPNTFIGIDLLSFSSSPNFHGVTEIPPGFHFLYSGTDASLALRHGQWLNLTKSTSASVHVFKWSTADEQLILLDAKAPEALAAASAIPTLRKRGLIDYRALEDATSKAQLKQDANSTSGAGEWAELASHIGEVTLDGALSAGWTVTSVSSAPEDTERIPGLTDLEASSALPEDSMLNFVTINLKQTWPDDAIGRERTEKARDRSWYLGQLMDTLKEKDRQAGATKLLGQLQLCFLMVLTLANYSCLEQWKRILTVIFTCQKALTEIEGYFLDALKVLSLQMEHVNDVDGGLFDLKDETSSAWLRQLVSKFRGNLEEVLGEESELRKALEAFESLMRDRYDWESGRDVLKRGMLELEDGERVEMTMDGADEDDETGEYAPVVVET